MFPVLLGNMFIPAKNMRGQASKGADGGVFIIPQKQDQNGPVKTGP
jgi:predicted RecA/RadA family phage recombinase